MKSRLSLALIGASAILVVAALPATLAATPGVSTLYFHAGGKLDGAAPGRAPFDPSALVFTWNGSAFASNYQVPADTTLGAANAFTIHLFREASQTDDYTTDVTVTLLSNSVKSTLAHRVIGPLHVTQSHMREDFREAAAGWGFANATLHGGLVSLDDTLCTVGPSVRPQCAAFNALGSLYYSSADSGAGANHVLSTDFGAVVSGTDAAFQSDPRGAVPGVPWAAALPAFAAMHKEADFVCSFVQQAQCESANHATRAVDIEYALASATGQTGIDAGKAAAAPAVAQGAPAAWSTFSLSLPADTLLPAGSIVQIKVVTTYAQDPAGTLLGHFPRQNVDATAVPRQPIVYHIDTAQNPASVDLNVVG